MASSAVTFHNVPDRCGEANLELDLYDFLEALIQRRFAVS